MFNKNYIHTCSTHKFCMECDKCIRTTWTCRRLISQGMLKEREDHLDAWPIYVGFFHSSIVILFFLRKLLKIKYTDQTMIMFDITENVNPWLRLRSELIEGALFELGQKRALIWGKTLCINWGCRSGWARFGTSKIFIVPKV